jgi:hypothetical protein
MWFLWPVPIYLAAAAGFLVLAVAGRRLITGTFGSRQSFWCPFQSKNVDVDFEKAVWDGASTDVTACTAFSPPGNVRCEKSCLMLGRFPAIRTEAPVPSH